jgi:hypothetical protein
MGSGAMTYIQGFIKFGSGIRKIIGRDSHRQDGDLISLLLFSQNKESGLKMLAVGLDHRFTGPQQFRTDAF